MLLDPLEEQLDLPALAVQLGDQLGFEGEVVGQKRNALARLFLDYHAARGGRVPACSAGEHGAVWWIDGSSPFQGAPRTTHRPCTRKQPSGSESVRG